MVLHLLIGLEEYWEALLRVWWPEESIGSIKRKWHWGTEEKLGVKEN